MNTILTITTAHTKVSVAEAFDLVKTGQWTLSQFDRWMDEEKSASWQEGYTEGYNNCLMNVAGD
jgi:hypothetical protein